MIERYLYLWVRSQAVRRFVARAQHAAAVQQEVLLHKLRRHADTAFGRDHGFAHIRSIADFRRQVPVADYEYVRPYVDRVAAGETTALFSAGTRVLMMALTSGTTNRPKRIPVTDESFAQYRRGWNLWGLKTYWDHPDLIRKKTLKLGSNWKQSRTEAGVPCGNISGLVAETAPWVARNRFALPAEVYQVDRAADKHYLALRLALAEPRIGMIGTANPSTLIEFARLADRRSDDLMRDLQEGGLHPEIDLPRAVRQALAPRLARKHPARVRQLQQASAARGRLSLQDAWPQLSVLAVWTGGSVGVYLPQLEEHYGRPALRDHGLSASEARMTIPLADETQAGLLEYDHHFFEFLPVEQRDVAQPVVLGAHELQIGREYFILLTTSSGLYRYDIYDVVRCVGYEGQAPMLVFLNKGAHFSNVTGEKLSEHQVVAAVQRSMTLLESTLEHFTLAPVMDSVQDGRPGYVLLIEAGQGGARRADLANCVDDQLQQQNVEYAEKRRSGRLRPVEVQEIPPGTWRRLRQQRTAERGNLEEYKHPCLVHDLGFVERLQSLAGA